MIYNKICSICNKKFEAKVFNKLVCSNECLIQKRKIASLNKRKQKSISRICKFCNKVYVRDRERSGFCSRSCGSKNSYELKRNKRKQKIFGKKMKKD